MQNDNHEATPSLGYDACYFLNRVKQCVDSWHKKLLFDDGGTSPTLARLRGLAGDLVRLVDSGHWSDWNFQQAVYEANEEHDIDVLLSQPEVDDDELERLFDAENDDAEDAVNSSHYGEQYLGGVNSVIPLEDETRGDAGSER